LRQFTPEQRAAGVVTHSSGNHGQAIACAAAALGITATIVMRADAPPTKIDSTRFWGAEIIFYDRDSDDREALTAAIAARTGAVIIPPYEHPHVIAGQGTLALELAADAQAAGLAMDTFLVCCGGGGLTAGCALALAPATKIYTVEPAGWDDTARSLASGTRERNDMRGSKFCDALLTPTPGELTFAINRHRVTAGLVVSNDDVRTAQAFAARHLKLIVEPGGAVALAALLAGKTDVSGQVVGVVLSGGNV
jgi:threonine dehydratase